MQKWVALILAGMMVACGSIQDYFKPVTSLFEGSDEGGGDSTSEVTTQAVVEPTATYAIAMGGVAPGRDQIAVEGDSFSVDAPIVGITEKKLIPQTPGITTLHYKKEGVVQTDTFRVVVPPQTLIQILVAEARGQMAKEIKLTNGAVALDSRSLTAEAIAWVVRNRVETIDSFSKPILFLADPVAYALGGDAAKYDAVIEAHLGVLYQFSPVSNLDPSHEVYQLAEARSFLPTSQHAVYDQSVLAAAGIFAKTIEDPTNGAFGFRTPTTEEWNCVQQSMNQTQMPSNCSSPDLLYPALAPIQILIHPKIQSLSDGRPSFLFYRTRTSSEPVTTNAP